MNKLAVLMLTAALGACSAVPRQQQALIQPDTRTSGAAAAPGDAALRGGHATPDGAAFLGFHGPVWRMNRPVD